jgi:hypothetical protein
MDFFLWIAIFCVGCSVGVALMAWLYGQDPDLNGPWRP